MRWRDEAHPIRAVVVAVGPAVAAVVVCGVVVGIGGRVSHVVWLALLVVVWLAVGERVRVVVWLAVVAGVGVGVAMRRTRWFRALRRSGLPGRAHSHSGTPHRNWHHAATSGTAREARSWSGAHSTLAFA